MDVRIEHLKVCNVHYNKDSPRHYQLPSDCTTLVEQTCITCRQKVKTTKLQPCMKHTLRTLNNGMLINSAISCCFFSEYCTESITIIDNEDLYHPCDTLSQTSSYVCMNCKEPFLELAKVKKAYDEQQEKMNKLLTAKIGKVVESEQANTKTNPPVMQDSLTVISNDYLAVSHQPIHLSKETQQQKEISSKRLMKAQQFRVEEVLKRVMEATKKEEDLFVGFVKKSSLTMSKSLFIDGKVTNNKKLLIKFLKDSIIAKHMVLGETIKNPVSSPAT